MDQKIKDKILEIIHQANDMIPEGWHELYINGDINGREGGIYFFYNTIGNPTAWQYSATMQFEIEGYSLEIYSVEQEKLFQLGVELQQIFRENNQAIWSKVILNVDENMKLTTEFDYADWNYSKYNEYQYMDYFTHEYLNLPLEDIDEALFEEMKLFKDKENSKQR
ncbi:immunity protein YezG family protein [Macrococcus armenti]|uniref:immunity protein YezG family protein n=1 Tax=Macrococcus armenti TaxID=2875764 RepID=UPI001CCEA13A|nr:immunity protein YezG family protein [Macrococcus armenti]UBH14805.1 antitoxin YezG family protein [Macrococcus armenti]UBH17164.1 antitoxin YezG family protein [Macrococcus armenti]UBH19430.1 antitoxin YezG family protein [Macrococcus armenti]